MRGEEGMGDRVWVAVPVDTYFKFRPAANIYSCPPPTAEPSNSLIQWSDLPSFYPCSLLDRLSPKLLHQWRRSSLSQQALHSLSLEQPSTAPPHNYTSIQNGASQKAASRTVLQTSYSSTILFQTRPRLVPPTHLRPAPCCRYSTRRAVSRITTSVVRSSTPCGTRAEAQARSRACLLRTKSPLKQTSIGSKAGSFLAYVVDPIRTTALVGTRRMEPTASARVSCGERTVLAKVSLFLSSRGHGFSCHVCKVYAYVPRVNGICSDSGVQCNDQFGISLNRGSLVFASGQCANYILFSPCGHR